ncbi:GNAT family N-acetyltransferase [Acuticoccus sediminis]|uniref:GNAT family N-acetyltransferase n=2 Tax=Acuticoccus sediminis TaxID=2184697 RepID=A0A8B2NKP6_9HYPH|nr:GNAT family N-acetyltransferase [Acuticoccus sediminis]
MDGDRDLFLTAWIGDTLAGSATLDRTITGGDGADGEVARLRWFIVSDAARGTGVGRLLLSHALAFADERGYRLVWLTTFAGLDAARHLYESHGFRLVAETGEDKWHGGVGEQRFERRVDDDGPARAAGT